MSSGHDELVISTSSSSSCWLGGDAEAGDPLSPPLMTSGLLVLIVCCMLVDGALQHGHKDLHWLIPLGINSVHATHATWPQSSHTSTLPSWWHNPQGRRSSWSLGPPPGDESSLILTEKLLLAGVGTCFRSSSPHIIWPSSGSLSPGSVGDLGGDAQCLIRGQLCCPIARCVSHNQRPQAHSEQGAIEPRAWNNTHWQ